MPKPGGNGKYNNNQSWKKYSEHDVRVPDNNRRVTFKHGRFGKKGPQRDWSNSIRAHLEEEDVDMGATGYGGSKRFFSGNKRGRGSRSGSPAPHKGGGMRRKLLESPTNWYRVTLPFGNKYDKEYVLQTLLERVTPIPFTPFSWSVNGTVATFYVDDYKLADKLHNLDRQIQCPDGFKMLIRVHSGSPNVNINADMKEKLKLAMAKRYNAATKALDLTKFHADQDLQDLFCALFKPIVLIAVIDIISEHIPELEALNLHDNRLQILSYLKKIDKKLPRLKILHLGNNKIRDISMLDSLIGLPIVDLVLDGNPLCDKFREQSTYISCNERPWNSELPVTLIMSPEWMAFLAGLLVILALFLLLLRECSQAVQYLMWRVGLVLARSFPFFCYSEVRKRFPKVIKLDGIDLPPPIGFDIVEEVSLPNAQQTFLCNTEGQAIVRQFLEQYFLIYDSDARQPLLQAYHENAMFSMTSCYPYGQHPKNASWLNWYNTDNRNLLRVLDNDRRHKLLRQGQLAVVSFLSEMPATKHDIHSFTVDLNLFTPQMLLLTVTGIFKELRSGHKLAPIRFFCRTLVIVPAGSGFCIANEQLHVTNATEEQAKLAFKTFVYEPEPLPTPAAAAASPPAPVASPSVPDENTRQQMIQAMSLQSGMNLEWSRKCLEETNWDFNRAAFVFTELQKQGTIPAAAFVK